MSTTELIELIKQMPADQQKEVEKLVFELTDQKNISSNITTQTEKKPLMKFSDLKGFVTYISDDFDEPMDEFKDYI